MSTTKHTPGPWRVNSKPDATSGGRTFVVLHEEKPGYHARVDRTYKGEFTEADAALIAAAPTMLEVLKEATKLMGYYRPHDKYPDGSIISGPSEILRKMAAAVAVAEGVDPGEAVEQAYKHAIGVP